VQLQLKSVLPLKLLSPEEEEGGEGVPRSDRMPLPLPLTSLSIAEAKIRPCAEYAQAKCTLPLVFKQLLNYVLGWVWLVHLTSRTHVVVVVGRFRDLHQPRCLP
jgi:hypothetical protein